MKYIFCLIMTFMLAACGNSDSKLPHACQDVFEAFENIQTKLETSQFATASMAAKFKQLNIDEFIPSFKKALSKESGEKQEFICKPIAKVLKNQLEQLSHAKSEAEIKEIFSGL